jgi:septal ring factor EnvC (AmiA/AmiB activator)
MADTKETDTDELDGITEEDAKRLLEKPKDDAGKKDEADDPGADQLSPAGQRALDRIKEDRRAVREERDSIRAELQKAQDELRKHSDKDKSENQRLQEERDSLKAELSKATSSMRRRESAEEHAPEHATPAQIRAVAKRLHGDTDAELEADAKELYALIAPEPATSKPPVSSKPRERLRGGGDPDEGSNETDPSKLAALLPRR